MVGSFIRTKHEFTAEHGRTRSVHADFFFLTFVEHFKMLKRV